MASSGTYAYAPEIAEFVDEAFERCGKNPEDLVHHHLVSARRSINLMFADWTADGVRQFALDEQTQTTTTGLAYYTPAAGTLFIVQAFVRRSGLDTPVGRITRDQYEGIPDKTQQGLPSSIFHDRKAALCYLWNVPENSTDVLHYFRVRRQQDVLTAAETPDLNYVWFEALASGLAARLAVKYAHDKVAMLEEAAYGPKRSDGSRGNGGAFGRARMSERERADTSITLAM